MAVTAVVSGNPYVVTGTTTTNDKVTDDIVRVKAVYWHVPTTAGHKLSVKRKDTSIVCQLQCEYANESQFIPVNISAEGIYVDDMDSGTLYIYID